MSSPEHFTHISKRVLKALDKRFPGWRDLVPEDQASNLNEETLIQLLKDKKRAEIYRSIADKRNELLKRLHEDSGCSIVDLMREFTSFSADQTRKWMSMEERMSAILLRFKSKNKSKPTDPKEIERVIDETSKKLGSKIDFNVNVHNTNLQKKFDDFFGEDEDGELRVGTSELKDFFNDKLSLFRDTNRRCGDRQKQFINDSVKKLSTSKLGQLDLESLNPEALDAENLLTEEELSSLAEEQLKVIYDAIDNQCIANRSVINDLTQRFMGVTGKENVLRKLDECPEHIVSSDVKKLVGEVIENDGFLVYPTNFDDLASSDNSDYLKKVTEIVAKFVATVLELVGLEMSAYENRNVSKEIESKDPVYRFCNSGTYYTAHIFTLGFCSGWTLGTNIGRAIQGKPVDWAGVSNAFLGLSFLVGTFAAFSWASFIKSLIDSAADAGCQALKDHNYKETARWCSVAVMVSGFFDLKKSKKWVSLVLKQEGSSSRLNRLRRIVCALLQD